MPPNPPVLNDTPVPPTENSAVKSEAPGLTTEVIKDHLPASAYATADEIEGALGGIYDSAKEAGKLSFTMNQYVDVSTLDSSSGVRAWNTDFSGVMAGAKEGAHGAIKIISADPVIREIAPNKFMAYAKVLYQGREVLMSASYLT